MHVLIVHCHPERHSFNGALTDVAIASLEQKGHSVELSDLYAQGFSPVEGPDHYESRIDTDRFSALAEQRHASETDCLPRDVQREIARLKRADLVVFQFPLWWHAQPAMLKGWFDRVFVSGGLYTSRMRYDRGFFRGKYAICSVTTGAPADAFGPGGRGGEMSHLLWSMHYSLHYMGFAVLPPFVAYGIQGHGFAYRDEDGYRTHLEDCKADWSQRVEAWDQTAPLCFPGWDDWDAMGRAKMQA